jgi:hypothetical protein
MFKIRRLSKKTVKKYNVSGAGLLISVVLAAIACAGMVKIALAADSSDPAGKPADFGTGYDMMLMITGSSNGDFEPCGCGGVYEGGLSRRATILADLKKSNPNLLLVDTGDITGGGQEVQWEFLSKAYHLLGYDAIALGESELRLGLDTLDEYVRKYNLPVVASNLKFTIPMAVRDVVTVERGGRKLAFISVVADRYLGALPGRVREALQYEPPADAIRRLVKTLKGKCDAIILLSHLGPSERDKIAVALDGVDVWIDTGGHQWTGRKRQTETTQPSFLIGDHNPPLLVSWSNDRKIGIAGLNWQGKTLLVPAARMIPVAREIKEDPRYLEIYDAYKFVSRQEMINRITLRKGTDSQPAEGLPYVSPETCGGCHQKNYAFWKSTPHARAFATLKKGNRDADDNCLSCHTTGFREPGGFETPTATPELRNVGCQSCHRVDLAKHHRSPVTTKQAAMAKIDARKQDITKSWQCQRCHVPHRSPKFDYRSYMQKINCSGAISEDKNPKAD